jgi:alpha-L-fucosidase
LFFYYSYGRDWEHPHGVFQTAERKPFRVARPDYDTPDPHYATNEEYDLSKYVDYVNAQVTELLTGYGPIAGIWFDAPPEAEVNYDTFKPYKIYEWIHKLQPHTIVSAKWGIRDPNGKHSFGEDFYAPELNQYKTYMHNGGKPIEVCHTFNHGWGWWENHKGNKGVEYIKNNMRAVNYLNANLLLNIGPMPDGSIWEEDRKALLEVGQWLKENGWPKERIHPKDANIGWNEKKAQPPFPNDGPWQPLKLPYISKE